MLLLHMVKNLILIRKSQKTLKCSLHGKKVGSGSNEPTQPGNLDKPSKDNGAVAKADKSAKTGDDFNLFAVGGVALAAIIAMAAVAITGKKTQTEITNFKMSRLKIRDYSRIFLFYRIVTGGLGCQIFQMCGNRLFEGKNRKRTGKIAKGRACQSINA